MAVKAKLKFRGDMAWDLEHKLLTKYGFIIHSRDRREWVVVEKRKSNFVPEVLVNGELPEEVQNTLNKRCITIVNHFDDPDAQLYIIRTRINNMSQTLPPLQRKYVQDWVERNVKED